MKLLFALLLASLLVSCSTFQGDAPPLRGTVRSDNPQAAALYQNAKNWEAAGNTKKALKDYRRLLNKYPADKRASESRFREAQLLTARGDRRDAFDAYQLFIEHYPSSPLYANAVADQEKVAHAAAEGAIRTNFLGLKSRLDRKVINEMLTKVERQRPSRGLRSHRAIHDWASERIS